MIERLQITRSERVAVSILMVLTVILSFLTLNPGLIQKGHAYDYSEADSIFAARSHQTRLAETEIMARYTVPAKMSTASLFSAEPDTTDPDSVQEEREKPLASGLINVNTASFEKLQELPGIGPAYASRIVEWREINGKFTSREQLMEIRGIGEKRLEQIRHLIVLEE
jgi:comEA protein